MAFFDRLLALAAFVPECGPQDLGAGPARSLLGANGVVTNPLPGISRLRELGIRSRKTYAQQWAVHSGWETGLLVQLMPFFL